jgi:hypothetical protein
VTVSSGTAGEVLAGAIFLGTYFVLAAGSIPGLRIDRTGAAIIGAGLVVVTGLMPMAGAVAAVDVPTLVLLFGMMIVAAFPRPVGLLRARHGLGHREGAERGRAAGGGGGVGRRPLGILRERHRVSGADTERSRSGSTCGSAAPDAGQPGGGSAGPDLAVTGRAGNGAGRGALPGPRGDGSGPVRLW